MQIVRGSVVRSKSGRDKGLFFVVLSVTGDSVQICNGKLRPIERPKVKNIKHICPTLNVLSEHSMKTNREIRKSLKMINDFQ